MLDQVGQVFVGSLPDALRVGEVTGTHEEEGRAPRAATVHAVTARAKRVVEALGPVGAARWVGVVEEPGQSAGQDPHRGDGGGEGDDRPAHGGEDSMLVFSCHRPT